MTISNYKKFLKEQCNNNKNINKPLYQFQRNPIVKQCSCVSTCSLFQSLVGDFWFPFVFCCFSGWISKQQTKNAIKKWDAVQNTQEIYIHYIHTQKNKLKETTEQKFLPIYQNLIWENLRKLTKTVIPFSLLSEKTTIELYIIILPDQNVSFVPYKLYQRTPHQSVPRHDSFHKVWAPSF